MIACGLCCTIQTVFIWRQVSIMVTVKNGIFQLVKAFCAKYPKRERPEILMQVFTAMSETAELGQGYDYKRAEYIKRRMGTGSIITFSKSGISVLKTNVDLIDISGNEVIRVPQNANMGTTCLGHLTYSLYELHNIVYSPELPCCAMPLKEYKAELAKLNAKSPVMLYE